MASGMFANGIRRFGSGGIDWTGDVIRAKLVVSSYDDDPQFDTHDALDDVPGSARASGTSDVVITGSINTIGGSNDVEFDHSATSLSFSTVTTGQRIGGVVIYHSRQTTESQCPVICYNKLTANVTSDGGTFTVNLAGDASNSIFKASY